MSVAWIEAPRDPHQCVYCTNPLHPGKTKGANQGWYTDGCIIGLLKKVPNLHIISIYIYYVYVYIYINTYIHIYNAWFYLNPAIIHVYIYMQTKLNNFDPAPSVCIAVDAWYLWFLWQQLSSSRFRILEVDSCKNCLSYRSANLIPAVMLSHILHSDMYPRIFQSQSIQRLLCRQLAGGGLPETKSKQQQWCLLTVVSDTNCEVKFCEVYCIT